MTLELLLHHPSNLLTLNQTMHYEFNRLKVYFDAIHVRVYPRLFHSDSCVYIGIGKHIQRLVSFPYPNRIHAPRQPSRLLSNYPFRVQ